MTLHANMIVFFAIAALIGAVYIARIFQSMRRPIYFGAGVGIVAGLVGPMLFMAPMQACTFEAEREPIDFWFGVALFGLGAFLLLWFTQWLSRLLLARDKAPTLLDNQTTLGVFRTNPIVPALLLLPTITILVVFLYYPLIDTFRLSSLLVRLGAPRTSFRCVSNFTEFFEPGGFDFTTLGLTLGIAAAFLVNGFLRRKGQYEFLTLPLQGVAVVFAGVIFSRTIEPGYREVMFNTFFIATSIVVFGLIIGLAIAYLAYQPVKGAAIYRTLLIWPYAISPAIAGIIFSIIFSPVAGILNHTIELLGGDGLAWITDPWLARFTIIIASIWKTLGFNILFYIAGLQTVPKDLMEAAQIDGASPWQRFRNVVMPALSPITFFLIVTNLTYSFFNIYGTIDFLTRGGPAGATSVSIYEIVQLGIRSKDLGRAAAQSIVLFLLVIAVTWFQFRTSGRKVSYGA